MTRTMRELRAPLALAATLAAFAFSLVSSPAAQGAVLGPYTPDANTLHLFHFDDASNPIVDSGTTPYATTTPTQAGSLNHTPYSAAFGNAGRLNRACCGNTLGHGEERGWWMNTGVNPTSLLGSTGGAFTIEMMIKFNQLGSDFFDIFRDDANNIKASANFGESLTFVSPSGGFYTTANNVIATNTWYHLAYVYDGNFSGPNDMRIYLTELNPSVTQANLLQSFTTTLNTTYSGIGDFQIGSRHSGQVNAYIDEFRISNIARAADDMLFGLAPPPTAGPQMLNATYGASIRDDSDNTVDGTSALYMSQTTWNDGAGAVLYWDMSQYAGMTVQGDATLTAKVVGVGTPATIGVYEVFDDNADWATPGERIDYWNRDQAANLNPSAPGNGDPWLDDSGSAVANYRGAIDPNSPLDTLSTAGVVNDDLVTWTIPAAVLQSWIDNPSLNAGLMLTKTVDGGSHFYLSGTLGSYAPNLSFEVSAVPEPSSFVLAGLGLVGLAGLGLRRRKK